MNIEEYFLYGWKTVQKTCTALTGLTVTVDEAAETLTRSTGSFITDGIAVGDLVTTTGFANGANNTTFLVTAVAALVLTVDDSGDVLVDVTADEGVGVNPLTKMVYDGRCLLGLIRVNTAVITVTPKNDTTALWGTIIDDAEFDIGCTPLYVNTSLKATFSADGSAWFFYKAI